MSKKILITLIVILIALIIFLISLGSWSSSADNPELDSFAQCLADKGIVMYGSESCYWCQREKSNFGDAWRFISYVDCFKEPQRCTTVGIEATPTWTFPDGKRLIGYQGLEKLAKESGCPLTK